MGPRSVRLETILAATGATLLVACTSVEFRRGDQETGTFTSSAWSITILSYDLPQHALETARANASDSQMPNLIVERELVVPYFGPLDFLLDIIGIRFARVQGSFGFRPGDATTGEFSTRRSK